MPLVLASLAACTGNGSPSAGPSEDRNAQVQAATRELIQCIRANGVPDLADPIFDDQGQPQFPAGKDPGNNPAVRAALEGPCRPAAERLSAVMGEEERGREKEQRPVLTAEDQVRLRTYTQCVRDHGFPDWPDADPTGRYVLPTAYPEGLGKGDRPIDRTFLSALETCHPLAPLAGTQIG